MRLLRSALRVVAATPDEQIKRLDWLGDSDADDFAESLNHAYHAALRRRMLSPVQDKAIAPIDDLFQRMSGSQNAHLWTPEALGTQPEWTLARQLASEALRLLPEGPGAEERVIR